MTRPGSRNEEIFDREERFHDQWAESIAPSDVKVFEFFEACTSPENRLIRSWLGNLKGKRLLELGCGAGEASVFFALCGADVTATDISGGMLDVVRRVAQLHGTEVSTEKALADEIPFADESFDVVYTANLLHHVDIPATLDEARRVLKPGGVFVSWDPLDHNPLINIYRRIATKVRTDDEHPLTMADLRHFRERFSTVQYETTWFFTLWIFLRFYLIERADPNKERYWKKIIDEHQRLESIYMRLERLDKVILRTFPFLRRYCWNIVIMAIK